MLPVLDRGFPGGSSGKEPPCQCRRHESCRFDPWAGKFSWGRKWQPSPALFLENATDRGAARAAVCEAAGSDMTERALMSTDGQTALAFKRTSVSPGDELHLLNRNRKPGSTLGGGGSQGVSRAAALPGSPVFSLQETALGPAL